MFYEQDLENYLTQQHIGSISFDMLSVAEILTNSLSSKNNFGVLFYFPHLEKWKF